MMKYYLLMIVVAADLALIILHLFQEHSFSTHDDQHSIDTHCLVGWHTGSVQTHTCASESNVALVTSALKGVIVGLLARQPHSAEHTHTHSLHLAQHLCYSEMFFSLCHT